MEALESGFSQLRGNQAILFCEASRMCPVVGQLPFPFAFLCGKRIFNPRYEGLESGVLSCGFLNFNYGLVSHRGVPKRLNVVHTDSHLLGVAGLWHRNEGSTPLGGLVDRRNHTILNHLVQLRFDLVSNRLQIHQLFQEVDLLLPQVELWRACRAEKDIIEGQLLVAAEVSSQLAIPHAVTDLVPKLLELQVTVSTLMDKCEHLSNEFLIRFAVLLTPVEKLSPQSYDVCSRSEVLVEVNNKDFKGSDGVVQIQQVLECCDDLVSLVITHHVDQSVPLFEARRRQPFEVRDYKHTDFRDCRNVKFFANIKPGNAHVNEIRCLKYTPDLTMSYKLNYSDDWMLYPQGRNEMLDVQPLCTCRLSIKGSKYRHLQDIKSVIPHKYHPFYDTLPPFIFAKLIFTWLVIGYAHALALRLRGGYSRNEVLWGHL
ncbi:hypothetical protein B566_EDAN013768 [Ephemera danica]|nr:hypothetical protein B566_EDAN013768 [Ephemera danica]